MAQIEELGDDSLAGIADWQADLQRDFAEYVAAQPSLEAAVRGIQSWFEKRREGSASAFSAWLTPALFMALLAGFNDVAADEAVANSVTSVANAVSVSGSFDLKFREAIEAFRRKGIISAADFAKLEAAAKARAFSVAGMTDDYALQKLKKSLQDAIARGQTANHWLTGAEDEFSKLGLSGVGDNAWHMRLVVTQNANTAYAAGRYKQMMRVVDQRPYWQYLTVGDNRVRPEHAVLDGIIRRADDPFWQKYYPPNGFGCRCMVVSVSREEALAEGLKEASDSDIEEAYAQLVPSRGGMPPVPSGFDYDPAAAFGGLEDV